MNRQIIIEQIVEAYLDSIFQADPEDWIRDVLMFGRQWNKPENKPFHEMNDDELLKAHRLWCEYLYEEDEQ
jgi:hypothetical protein